MSECDYMGNYLVSRKRLNKLFKYYKNKTVKIVYNYNNSMNMNYDRVYEGKYTDFKIECLEIYNDFIGEYKVTLYKNDKAVFEQDFASHAVFYGLGEIKELNSGPWCYFTIAVKN